MADLLVIANKALRLIGKTEIQSLTQLGPVADRCNKAIRDVIKEVLGEHTWAFATVWASLPKLLAPPPFGYDYAYQLPSEAIKLIDCREEPTLDSEPISYDVARGKVVYTDAALCYARYVVYVEADLNNADPNFIKACSCLLAAELAPALAKSTQVAGLLTQYDHFLQEAKLTDSLGSKPPKRSENATCSFLTAREFPTEEEA